MPQSIVRFLRVYASVVMLLVAGVMAIGTQPAVALADFGNVEATFAHAPSRTAKRIVSFHHNRQVANFSFGAIEAAALGGALASPSLRTENSSIRTCPQPILRVLQQS